MDKIKHMPTMGGAPQQRPQITHDMVRNSKIVECSCGHRIFENVVVLKKLSAIISPTGNEELLPIQALACKKCGLIHNDSDAYDVLPDDMKTSNIIKP